MDTEQSEGEKVDVSVEAIAIVITEIKKVSSCSRKKRKRLLDEIIQYLRQAMTLATKKNQLLQDIAERVDDFTPLIIDTLNLMLPLSEQTSKIDSFCDSAEAFADALELFFTNLRFWCESENGRPSFHSLTCKVFTNFLTIATDNAETWFYSLAIGGPIMYILWVWGNEKKSSMKDLVEWSKDMLQAMYELGKCILKSRDFTCQYTLVLVMLQWLIWTEKQVGWSYVNTLFPMIDHSIRKILTGKTNRDNDYIARIFLNSLNSCPHLSNEITSLHCLYFFAGNDEILPPKHQHLPNFWIDFSTGSRMIHCFCTVSSSSWVNLNIRADHIDSICVSWARRLDNNESQDLLAESHCTTNTKLSNMAHNESLFFLHIYLNQDFDLISSDLVFFAGKEHRSLVIVFINVGNLEEVLSRMRLPIHTFGEKFCARPKKLNQLIETTQRNSISLNKRTFEDMLSLQSHSSTASDVSNKKSVYSPVDDESENEDFTDDDLEVLFGDACSNNSSNKLVNDNLEDERDLAERKSREVLYDLEDYSFNRNEPDISKDNVHTESNLTIEPSTASSMEVLFEDVRRHNSSNKLVNDNLEDERDFAESESGEDEVLYDLKDYSFNRNELDISKDNVHPESNLTIKPLTSSSNEKGIEINRITTRSTISSPVKLESQDVVFKPIEEIATKPQTPNNFTINSDIDLNSSDDSVLELLCVPKTGKGFDGGRPKQKKDLTKRTKKIIQTIQIKLPVKVMNPVQKVAGRVPCYLKTGKEPEKVDVLTQFVDPYDITNTYDFLRGKSPVKLRTYKRNKQIKVVKNRKEESGDSDDSIDAKLKKLPNKQPTIKPSSSKKATKPRKRKSKNVEKENGLTKKCKISVTLKELSGTEPISKSKVSNKPQFSKNDSVPLKAIVKTPEKILTKKCKTSDILKELSGTEPISKSKVPNKPQFSKNDSVVPLKPNVKTPEKILTKKCKTSVILTELSDMVPLSKPKVSNKPQFSNNDSVPLKGIVKTPEKILTNESKTSAILTELSDIVPLSKPKVSNKPQFSKNDSMHFKHNVKTPERVLTKKYKTTVIPLKAVSNVTPDKQKISNFDDAILSPSKPLDARSIIKPEEQITKKKENILIKDSNVFETAVLVALDGSPETKVICCNDIDSDSNDNDNDSWCNETNPFSFDINSLSSSVNVQDEELFVDEETVPEKCFASPSESGYTRFVRPLNFPPMSIASCFSFASDTKLSDCISERKSDENQGNEDMNSDESLEEKLESERTDISSLEIETTRSKNDSANILNDSLDWDNLDLEF